MTNVNEQLIAARAGQMVAYRRERDAQAAAALEAAEPRWWAVGLAMFAIGLTSGIAWWALQTIPGFDPLPRILG